MLRAVLAAALFFAGTLLCAAEPAGGAADGLVWHDAAVIGLEGRGWTDGLESDYDRLPLRAKDAVGAGIWGYARHSAGLSVRFNTDATEIHVRYRLKTAKTTPFADVSAQSASGVDLYVQTPSGWRFAASNKPKSQDVLDVLAKGLAPGRRLYQLYLPLYNGVEKFEVGVPAAARFEAVTPRTAKPVVFFGTSITQGGVASRPGLAFPSILGRRLDVSVVNLGFCGYGKMEPPFADLLPELDASVFVIDALQNMQPTAVTERAAPLIRAIRAAHPSTPILLVGFGDHPAPELFPGEVAKREKLNAALQSVFDALVAAGDRHLHFLPGTALLGSDGEATGDTLHPNALGMMRYADAYEPVLRTLLSTNHR